jgi:hypothetical protein
MIAALCTVAAWNSMRILGVFAHPDDEIFCTGGIFAKYAAMGAEAMIVLHPHIDSVSTAASPAQGVR